MTKRISSLTRRDLIDVVETGFVINELDEGDIIDQKYFDVYGTNGMEIHMPFSGRMDEIEFLSRLYNLGEMPSNDSRFKNADGDIWQHRINNYDWEDYWFFNDDRFLLKDGYDDEYLLRFICEMIHPAVVAKNSPWRYYLRKFNEILSPDGYEIYPYMGNSGREEFHFRFKDSIEIKNHDSISHYALTQIGSGSYANVFRFTDSFYGIRYALKRAKKDLDKKELERFKLEYDEMRSFHSPHILDVYTYDEDKNQYIMEYMDMTLEEYISKNNDLLSADQRKTIICQLIAGYGYLHRKGCFHRDVSFRNVLIKEFDEEILVKISDFGLVKIPESDLTSEDTEFKGSLNDPELRTIGFRNYSLSNEIYSLTLLFAFIITGKKNVDNIKSVDVKAFILKGTNLDKGRRFQSLDELKEAAIDCLQ